MTSNNALVAEKDGTIWENGFIIRRYDKYLKSWLVKKKCEKCHKPIGGLCAESYKPALCISCSNKEKVKP